MTSVSHIPNPTVLVVGAGPAGLAAAIDLARRGVDVRIIDRLPGPRPESRALAIWPRTLDILQQLECLNPADHADKQLRQVSYDFGTGTPYRIALPAARRPLILPQPELEALLHAAAHKLGIPVSWNCELVSLAQDRDTVTADVRLPSGSTHELSCRYLIGADGASSTVRGALGIGFPGRTVPDVFFLADCTLEGVPEDGFQNFVYRSGYAAICPLPDGRYRLFAKIAPGQETDSLNAQTVLGSLGLDGITVTSTGWTSTFRIHERVGERYRDRRIFLVGDAVHTHSPAGGQGIQTGIGDTYNLIWKLAAVLNGQAQPNLLDTYEPERAAAARATITRSHANARLWDGTSGARRTLTQAAFGLAHRAGILQRRIIPAMAGYSDTYPALLARPHPDTAISSAPPPSASAPAPASRDARPRPADRAGPDLLAAARQSVRGLGRREPRADRAAADAARPSPVVPPGPVRHRTGHPPPHPVRAPRRLRRVRSAHHTRLRETRHPPRRAPVPTSSETKDHAMRTPHVSIAAGTVVYPPLTAFPLPPEADEPGATVDVPVAGFAGAPHLAVEAAKNALDAATVPPAEVAVNAHAWVNYQGHDLWSPQHFIAHSIGAQHARSYGISDVCNGGESAIESAAARLLLEGERFAVTTTADIFALPSFDRFTSDVGIWYGDAGTGLLLEHRAGSTSGGVELLSTSSTSIPRVERMHRAEHFAAYPAGSDRQVDVRATKSRYLAAGGGLDFVTAIGGALRAVVLGALRDAGIEPSSPTIRHLFLPRIDEDTLGKVYLPPLHGLTGAQFTRLPDSLFGHLGAGDTPANLIEFAATGDYAPGDIALFVCAGSGFTVSCVCVRLPAPEECRGRFRIVRDFHADTHTDTMNGTPAQ